jgi:hypothetical protein
MESAMEQSPAQRNPKPASIDVPINYAPAVRVPSAHAMVQPNTLAAGNGTGCVVNAKFEQSLTHRKRKEKTVAI